MATAVFKPAEADRARARAAAYSLIAHAFRYPDREWLRLLAEENRWRAWPEQLSESHAEAIAVVSALRASIVNAHDDSAIERLQAQFASLFGHTVRGACPPYELEFGQGEIIQRASELADIGGFYAAFGMDLSGAVNERADHVSVEAEFLAVLCAKEAWGIDMHDRSLVEGVRDAQGAFLKAHFGAWLSAFCRRVRDCDSDGVHSHLSQFASSFVACECRRFGVATGSPYLRLRPVDPAEEVSQACGVPAECNALQGERLTQLNLAVGKSG